MTESATNRFLKRIIPAGHSICLARHRPFPDPTRPKMNWRQSFYGAKAQKKLDTAIAQALTDTDTNTYFAVAGYDKTKKRGVKNVTGIKVLILDVDIGKGASFYATKTEVFPGLRDLHKACPSLPAPWLVDSGNGIHVYYELDRTLTTAKWGPLAALFADVVRAVAPKLIADPVRTRDAASVMRLPGSWNAKQKKRLPVKILREGTVGDTMEITATLAQAAANHNVSGVEAILGNELLPNMPSIPSYMDIGVGEDFGLGMESKDKQEFKDLDLRPILTGCKQMREIFQVKGNVPEPLWVNYLRVLNTVRNPDDVAVAFSNGHPTSSEAATRRKMRHIRQNFDTATCGCDEFKNVNRSGCHGCPHKGNIWTPSQLAVLDSQQKEIETAKEEAAESAISGQSTAKGYIQQGSYIRQKHAAKTHFEITSLPVRQPGKKAVLKHEVVIGGHVHLAHSSAQLTQLVVNHQDSETVRDVRVHLDIVTQGKKNRVVVPMNDLSSSSFDKITEQLRTNGLAFKSVHLNQKNAVIEYVQELVSLSASRRKFYRPTKGWLKTGRIGGWSFVTGSRTFKPDGSVEENITSAEHMGENSSFHGFMERNCTGRPKGRLSCWQDGMSVYNGKKMAVAQLLLLSGLSNTLMPLLSSDKGGIVLSLTGESGAGKTTLLKHLASFIGDHDGYIVPGSSTVNALGQMLREANCLILPVDDSLAKNGESFSSLLAMVSGGSEKMRMQWTNSTGGVVPWSEGFNTSILLTSNFSTTSTIGTAGSGREQLQTEAARSRTLEFPSDQIIDIHESIPKAQWDRARELITTNHGHAAHKFLQYVTANQALVQNALRAKHEAIAKRLRQHIDEDKAGQIRFWARFLAVTAITARIVCDTLSLLPWEVDYITAAGEDLVSETVTDSLEADVDLVESFWDLCIKEQNPNNPEINIVTKEVKLPGPQWSSWKTMARGDRLAQSEWCNKSVNPVGGVQLPAAGEHNAWRVDVYTIYENDVPKRRERTMFIPIARLKHLVNGASGNALPVADWSDLYTRLRTAGCIINGLHNKRPDKLTKTNVVNVNLGLSKLGVMGYSRKLVEIRLPPQPLG